VTELLKSELIIPDYGEKDVVTYPII